VLIVVRPIHILLSGLVTIDSISQGVRLSGSESVVILNIQFASVVKSALKYAVSLKTHLFLFESHHFT